MSWKLSRTVLRGAVGGNADRLLDNKFASPPKQPYAFELSSGGPFAFAGLWDAWKDREGHWLQSFAIVTTEANELIAPIHPRMPVILHARDYDRWLDREETERLPLDLLRPFESEALWSELNRERRERAWKTVDRLNATLGRGTVRILSAGPKDAVWKLRADHRSPRWTTRWDELPKVHAS